MVWVFFLGYTSYSFWVSFLYLIHSLKSIILIPYHQLLLKTSPCPAPPSLPSFFHMSSRPASPAEKTLPHSFQAISHVQLFATPWTTARQASLSITNSQSLPKLMSMSQWCHPTISSSVVPFSSCSQSFPASGSFQMSQLFASGGQSTGVSASTSVLPMNTQDQSPLGWTGWISLQSKGLSRVFSNTIVQKHQFFGAQLSL